MLVTDANVLSFFILTSSFSVLFIKKASFVKNEAFSGPSEIRTHDLLNAIETRSQLRYRPINLLFL